MSVQIDSIIRKLLILYPNFGSVIENLKFEESKNTKTASTNGKVIRYNVEFVESLKEKEKIALFLHEICHVAFDHIARRDGKNRKLWNIATDAVINALLKKEGLPLIEGGIDIPEAINYDSDEMYEYLLQKMPEEDYKIIIFIQGEMKLSDMENYGEESHSLWDEIENEKMNENGCDNNPNSNAKDSNENNQVKDGERKAFEKNKEEREQRLKEFNRELLEEASLSGNNESTTERRITDIGIASHSIDWRRILKQTLKGNQDWTRINSRIRNNFFRYRLYTIPETETEILLDTSSSVNDVLLRNFLKECKHILKDSKVKIGCFDTQFYGFKEIKKNDDIDNLKFSGGGGTDFNVAMNSFSQRATNKIIFTDGESQMPYKEAKDVIWIVYGDKKIEPKGGKVIYIDKKRLN